MRIQGKEFADMKHLLKMYGFSITKNNNIKAYLSHKKSHYRFTHYLNDTEKEKFINSEYFKESFARKKKTKMNTVIFSVPNSGNSQGFDYSIKPKLNILDK